MSFENPVSSESVESYDFLYAKAIAKAQMMSVKWSKLPKDGIEAERWQAFCPDIAGLFQLNEGVGGKSGIQKFFEDKIDSANLQNNEGDKMIAVRRLIIDLDRLDSSLDSAIEISKK